MPVDGQCPECGVSLPRREAAQAAPEGGAPASPPHQTPAGAVENWRISPSMLLMPLFEVSRKVFAGRCAVLFFVALWGLQLIALDYRTGDMGASFMHLILLPIHEAGHVFFIPFGRFLATLGGSFFQVALPLGIGVAFVLKNRDNFGAAICLCWAGASLLDLAPYVYDALQPQLMMLGGHTGADSPHDWIYLLDRIGQLPRAQRLGALMHKLGAGVLLAGLGWGAAVLVRQRRYTGAFSA